MSGLDQPPPVPEAFWRRFREFLAAGRTGQLVFHAVKGEVVGLDVNEMYRKPKES